METTNQTVTNKLSALDKTYLLTQGRFIARNFWRKKSKYINERDAIKNDFEAALDKELKKLIADFREKGKARLEKKLAVLNKKIEEINAAQASIEKIIVDKTGYGADDIFDYEIVDSGSSKNVKVTFKYPDVIPPVEIEHDGVHHLMDADGDVIEPEDAWDDEAVAAQTSPTEEPEEAPEELPMPEEPVAADEDDTPFDDEPEYDSAGFSTEDGLAEGEPAELAEQVNNIPEPTDEERELLEQQWQEEKEAREQADAMLDAFAEQDLADDDPFDLD